MSYILHELSKSGPKQIGKSIVRLHTQTQTHTRPSSVPETFILLGSRQLLD